ncbi:MAG TPA: hypothetical protein VK887_11165 [Pseudonocardiaceae bacterium]|nr:hypothetical protein [Pseudonocardiaceae bacterium]
MAKFRMRYGALFTSCRARASVTVSVSVVIESPKPASARLRSGVEHHRAPEADDHPELRAQWRALPKSIRPEDWVTETGVKHVPGSLLIAEAQRPSEGYYPAYG